MSLFDDNFISVMEKDEQGGAAADAAAAAEDENKDDAPAEGSEECGTEGCDPDDPKVKQAAESAVDIDINADSLEEAYGYGRLIDDEVEESHFACLEAVAINTAFDQVDIACTEAYQAAATEYEKSVVTEKFTDNVKKYAARIKAFLVKLKNLVVRIFNKAFNYIKVLAGRVNAKFSSLRKLGDKDKVKDDTKVKVCNALLGDFASLADDVDAKFKSQYDALTQILKDSKTTDAESLKTRIDAVTVPEKSAVIKEIRGDESEMNLGGKKASDFNGYLDNLKQASITAAHKYIKDSRDNMWKAIGEAEKAAKSADDIDTAKITCITAALNKLMAVYNRTINAKITLLLAWINARAKIVRAAGWHQTKESYIPAAGESLFDKYFSMI